MAEKDTTQEAGAEKRPRGNPNFQKKDNEAPAAPTEAKASGGDGLGDDTPPAPTELPADLFSDAIPTSETTPLDGPVKEKAYAALPTDIPAEGASTGAAPAPDGTPAPEGATATAVAATPAKTPEEIQSQAAQTADLMIKGYEKLHALGRWIGKVDDSDLAQLHVKGKIDLNLELPLGKKTVTIKDFFDEYNNGIEENITVSQEFKDNVRPPLIRICIKHNLLLSDELYVGMIVADDLTTKTAMLIGLKKSANLVLDACMRMTEKLNEKASKKATTSEPAPGPDPEEQVDWHEPEASDGPATE